MTPLNQYFSGLIQFLADAMRGSIKSKKFLSILAMGLFARER